MKYNEGCYLVYGYKTCFPRKRGGLVDDSERQEILSPRW